MLENWERRGPILSLNMLEQTPQSHGVSLLCAHHNRRWRLTLKAILAVAVLFQAAAPNQGLKAGKTQAPRYLRRGLPLAMHKVKEFSVR